MNMNKKNKSIIAVYGILAFIYLIAFITIPFPKNAASWISFVGILCAMFMIPLLIKAVNSSSKDILPHSFAK